MKKLGLKFVINNDHDKLILLGLKNHTHLNVMIVNERSQTTYSRVQLVACQAYEKQYSKNK